MKSSIVILSNCFLILALATHSACERSPNYQPGKPYYFEGYAHYQIPFKPVNLISREKAIQFGVYYIAVFNPRGQISSFRKEIKGRMQSEDEYYYDDSGRLVSRRMTKANSEIITQDFDQNGKLIPSSTKKVRQN